MVGYTVYITWIHTHIYIYIYIYLYLIEFSLLIFNSSLDLSIEALNFSVKWWFVPSMMQKFYNKNMFLIKIARVNTQAERQDIKHKVRAHQHNGSYR